MRYDPDCQVRIVMRPGALDVGRLKAFDSLVLQRVAEKVPPYERYDPEQWAQIINRDRIEALLKDVVAPAYATYYTEQCRAGGDRSVHLAARTIAGQTNRFPGAFAGQLERESALAGALLFLTGTQAARRAGRDLL